MVWPRPPRPPPTGRFAAGALAARIVGGDVARKEGSPLYAGRYDTDAPFARAYDNDGASAASALVRGDDVYWYNWDAALDSRETQRAGAVQARDARTRARRPPCTSDVQSIRSDHEIGTEPVETTAGGLPSGALEARDEDRV